MAKKLQLLRNSAVFESKALALAGIKAKLITLAAGEPAIASYTDGDDVSILLGISYGDGTNYQIFEGAKLATDGSLELPESIKVELGKIQAELDATQVGAGLNEDGAYTAKGDANYISGVTSLKGADEALDAALKAEETARIAKDTELEGKLDSLTATVEKNKVVAGQGITVDTSGANTTISAKVKAGDNALKVDDGGLYVDDSVLDTYVGSGAIAVSEAVEGEKTISLTIDETDKVLTQAVSGLKTSLSLNYASDTKKLQLLGNTVDDSNVISEIDAAAFVKDGILQNVELVVLSEGTETNPDNLADGTYLKFTFNTDAGAEEIYVNVTSLIDIYTGGNGITITGKSVAVKIDPSSEPFLTVGADGVKLSGVQTAIDQAEADAITAIKGTAVDYPTLGEVETKLDEIETKLAGIDAYTVNGKAINTNPVLGGADIVLTDYVRSVEENDDLQLEVTDTVNGAFGKLEKAILDNEEVCSKAFDAVKAAVGLDVNLGYVAVEGANYIAAATSVQDADSKLDAAIKAVDDKVAAEVGKEYLTSVVAGNGIEVSAKASNSQTITAKVVATDPIIEVTANGIGTKADAVWDCGTY